MESIGLYIHVPFCRRKCPYCDFYSLPQWDDSTLNGYVAGVTETLHRWRERVSARADTLYFGGGTPSLLGGERICRLIEEAERCYGLFSGEMPEVTLEANPAELTPDTLVAFAAAGGNRLSLGMQSGVGEELRLLGRRHAPEDVAEAVSAAHRAGIDNISLDLMLGISGQTEDSAARSARLAAELGATHVSAYMLKLEPDTPYGKTPPPLPEEERVADIYLATGDLLESLGYSQYEISNFALPGRESRHNLKYWDSRPYLGIGPAASSCIGGNRFTYSRSLVAFLAGEEPVTEPDEVIPTGSPMEYALLRLRLAEGLTEAGYRARFGESLPAPWRGRAAQLPKSLVQTDALGIRLTREGFLLSNSLTGHILGE